MCLHVAEKKEENMKTNCIAKPQIGPIKRFLHKEIFSQKGFCLAQV